MSISIEQFVDRLADSCLLEDSDVQTFVGSLPADQQPQDGQQLSQLLVKQSKLTAYQAQEILCGNGQSLVLGNYVIFDKLGQGGMGMVLKAEHRRMKRIVALKVLSPTVTMTPEAVARFQREVEAAAKLRHQNIVAADDADKAKGIHFLVMEYVEGCDLSVLVKENGPLSVDRAVDCILQAARGLEYAHQRGVVHRDIKPSNLLRGKDGTVKILDMGLARLESAGADQDQLTGTGQIMGTIDYMAPEQASDTRSADARSDLYALGMTLWYLLTGRAVYQGESIMAKLLAHREAPIPSLRSALSHVPHQLDAIFARMVAKEPKDRYQNMGELIADLEAMQHGGISATARNDCPPTAFRENHTQKSRGPGDAKNRTHLERSDAALEPTLSLQLSQIDTDTQTQIRLDVPLEETNSINARGGKAHFVNKTKRHIISWLAFIPKWRIGLICSIVSLLVTFAAFLHFVLAGEGVIRVEMNDPQIEVKIQGTEFTFKHADQGKAVKVSTGEKTLVVQRGEFQFETNKLNLNKGETVTVRVELQAGKIDVRQGDHLICRRELPRLPRPSIAKAPFDEDKARQLQQVWADYLGEPIERDFTLPGGEILTMVLIPPGEFLMGSNDEERAEFAKDATTANDTWAIRRIPNEGPQHRVRITKPFYLGKYEVTQGQWESVMGNNPSKFKDSPSLPLEQISCSDIQPFLAKLNAGQSASGMTFALPTVAQWEYACRSGTTTPYCAGTDEDSLRKYGWNTTNSGGKTHPVGELLPNGFGLFDIHGNVWEWCADRFGEDYYGTSPEDDPTGPIEGLTYERRGGSWYVQPRNCRSAYRSHDSPELRNDDKGFRLACFPAE